MAKLQAASIVDLVNTVQEELGPPKWTDLSQTMQDYTAMRMISSGEGVEESSGGNGTWRRVVQVDHTQSYGDAGLFQVYNVDVPDLTKTITGEFRHNYASYAYDQHEVDFSRAPAEIVNQIKIREHGTHTAMAEGMETDFWGAFNSAATDKIWPVNYWLVYNATEGFTGTTPGSETTVAGLSPTTYPAWANYSGQYANVDKNDLVSKMRSAFRKTNFKPSMDYATLKAGKDKCQIYCNEDTIKGFENLGEAQNENLGRDIASQDGKMVFRQCPINYVPYLDLFDAAAPVYMINWAWFRMNVLKGWKLKRKTFMPANQPHVAATVIDLSWNTMCLNRRAQAVFAKTTVAVG